MKHHAQGIRPSFQQAFRRHSPAPEHIVTLKDSLIVHIYVGECVEPLKNQIDVFVRNHRRIGIKCRPVLPIHKADPLKARVVIPVERIGNQIVVQQIRLDHARHLGGMPFFELRAIGGAGSSELPLRVEHAGC